MLAGPLFKNIWGSVLSIRKVKVIRALGKVLFILYVGFLIYFLFVAEWYGRTEISEEYRYNLELFKEIRRFITYREQLGTFVVAANLLGNILIFMPYGFFISMAGETRGFIKTFFYSMFLSLGVEIVQLVTKVGSFDVDDILLNTIGGVLGYLVFVICNRIRRNIACSESKRAPGSAAKRRKGSKGGRGNTGRRT